MNEIKKIVYSCRQATLLIEKKQLTKLTIRERIELRLHLTGCSVCKLYQQQSLFINKQVKSLFRSGDNREKLLDELFKKDLQDQIDKKIK